MARQSGRGRRPLGASGSGGRDRTDDRSVILPEGRRDWGFAPNGTFADFLSPQRQALLLVEASWKVSTQAEEEEIDPPNDAAVPQSACIRDRRAGIIKTQLAFVACVWSPTEVVAVRYHADDLDILRARIAVDGAAAARLDRAEISWTDYMAIITQADVRANSERGARASSRHR
jgi:hypothetical protein